MPGVVRPMLWLAMPVLVEQILATAVGFVDTWLAGRFLPGAAPLAAIGLMAYTLWLIPSMYATVVIGTTALVSRHVGAAKPNVASWITNQAFACGSAFTVLVVALTWFGGPWFVATMNLEDEAARLALRYLRLVTPVIPAIMIERVGIAALRAAGDTITGFFAMTLVNLVNAVVSTMAVIGWGPFPRLGWDGLALGTVAGHVLAATILVVILLRGRAGLKLNFRHWIPRRKLIWRILKIGLPGGGDVAAVLFCHLWFLGIINGLGTLAAAAHSLAIRIESIAYLPAAAFQVAATTMAGQYLGARDPERAKRGALAATVAGVAMLTATGLLFFFGAETLTGFFTGSANEEASRTAAPLLRLAAFSLPSLALTMTLTGALRGAGDTRWPFFFTLIGMVGLRIPLAIFLGWDHYELPWLGLTVHGMGWGIRGAWYGMLADIFVRSALVVARFTQGGWQSARI